MDIKFLESLEEYNKTYLEKVFQDNAQQAISDFDENWKVIVAYSADDLPSGQSKYGQALIILSVAYYDLQTTTEEDLNYLSKLINEYDKNKNVKYKFNVKQTLFLNLGLCWYKLGYDNKAIEAFKKDIYYLITLSSNTMYNPTAYAFKKCTTFLYQALINEQLNLSSPTTFNDPFDCPIKELLNNGDGISTLQLQAYKCLKIACFTSNVKLPYNKDPNDWFSDLIYDEKKHRKDKKEFLNELMWAHYADSHRGICIKYRFSDSISQLSGENEGVAACFKDIKYASNEEMSKYSKKDSINLKDAFFLKGEQWKYENELRFLHYDLNNQSDYGTIEIPNSIEAIYFGLKYSRKDKEAIQNILKTKRFIQKDIFGNKTDVPIKFYQMAMDYKHFGQLKAVKLN